MSADALMKDFQSNGYVLIPDVVSPAEIAELFGEVEQILDIAIRNLGGDPKNFSGIDAKYMHLQNAHPTFKGRAYDLMKQMERLLALAMKRKIIDFVKLMFGGPVLLDLQQVRADDPTNLRALPLHQEGFGQISLNAITAWTPLRDVSPATGTMAVIAGSHKRGYVRHQHYPDMNNGHGVAPEYTQSAKVDPITARAGTAVVFDPRLIHGTVNNPTGAIRWTAICRYCDPQQAPYLSNPKAELRIPQTDLITVD